MKPAKSRFQAEVRFGLLSVIFLLLFLNFASNFLIFNTRSGRRQATETRLRNAAVEAARIKFSTDKLRLPPRKRSAIMAEYRLDRLVTIPFEPADDSPEARRRWFSAVAESLPVEEFSHLAEHILGAEPEKLTSDDGAVYTYVYPTQAGDRRFLIIASAVDHELAYLDDINQLAMVMSVIAVGTTIVVYLILSHIIFVPFRRLRREVEQAGRQVPDDTDDVEGVITEYRRVISELRDKEHQLILLNEAVQRKADSLAQFNRYLLQSMRSGVLTVDREGTVRSVNEAACKILDLADTATVGRNFLDVLPPQSDIAHALTHTLETGESREYQEMTCNLGSRTLSLAVSGSTIRDLAGDIIGASLLVHDVTELMHLRAQLETSERLAALGEMAGGLAHQLRNSMGAIGGYLTLLKKRLSRHNIDENYLAELKAEAAEAETLVNRFLEFARPLKLNLDTVNLGDFMNEIAAAFKYRDSMPEVEVRFGHTPRTTVAIDTLLLKQALTNLIQNAAQSYRGQPGVVQVSARATRDDIVIRIADHGCGIAPRDLRKIFTPFYSSRPSGNGLGLPLVNKIVDLHHGRLEVESQPDVGSTFTLILPVNVPAAPDTQSIARPV